jgi:hypothetical protein
MSVALFAGLAVLVLIIAIAISQPSGPRVTRIETRREREDQEDGK